MTRRHHSVETEQPPVAPGEIAATRWRRLVLGETAVDFWGRRWWWFGLSLAMIVISVVSLSVNGLNLGLDFTGGVAWDVPAENFSVDEAEEILGDNGIDATSAKIQERSSDSGAIIKVQVDDQPEEVRTRLQQAFAEGRRCHGERHQRLVGFVAVGLVDHQEGDLGARHLPRADRDLHLDPLRVADGGVVAAGDGPRRGHFRRDLLGVRLRRHPSDGHRLSHRARLLAVRHDRRVRPGQGERAAAHRRWSLGRRPRERVGEPGAVAIAEHHASRLSCRWCRCSWWAPGSSAR